MLQLQVLLLSCDAKKRGELPLSRLQPLGDLDPSLQARGRRTIIEPDSVPCMLCMRIFIFLDMIAIVNLIIISIFFIIIKGLLYARENASMDRSIE